MPPTDANATGPSSTPLCASAVHTSTIKSTPNSHARAAVISSHISFLGADVDHLRPWMERDLEQAQPCHFDAMLRMLKVVEPTSEVKEQLGIPEPTKGSRVLYILVSPKLQPITKLHGRRFFDVWKQCILCHFDLWQGGVYYRDVSAPNMMWYEKDGILMGVLNDYDLSSLASAQCPQGNERTGTVPFMALDLLTPKDQGGEIKHLYRHDLESFIWVLVWVCLRYKDGRLLTFNRPFDDWATQDAVTVGEKKFFFLHHFLPFKPKDIDPLMWSLIAYCLQVLKQESEHREALRFKQEMEGMAIAIERDDKDFLDLFMSTKGWVGLSM